MSEELSDREAELGELYEDVRSTIASAKKMRGKERVSKIDYLRDRLDRAKKAINAYRVEVRYLELSANLEYKEKLRQFEKKCEELNMEVEYLEKDELTGDTKMHVDSMSADQMLGKAADIQKDDIERLHDMIDKTEVDKQLAVDTVAAMQKQSEQLDAAKGSVKKMESQMTLASRQLRVFAKRIATDKIIMIVLVIVFLAVVAVIVVAAVKPVAKKAADVFT